MVQKASPFEKAQAKEKRLKVLLYGPSGCGKTTLAAQFPAPAFIDMERGTDHYAGKFTFDVRHTVGADDVESTIDWLLTHENPYATLVIDPVTVFKDALQRKWSEIFFRTKKGGAGHKHEFYDFQIGDWGTIKGEHGAFLRKLTLLDCNVVLTAHARKEYAENKIMQVIGETYDGQKGLDFWADIVLYMQKEGNKYLSTPIKDRTGKLPREPFPSNYSVFQECYSKEYLERVSVPQKLASDEQVAALTALTKDMKPELVATALQKYGAEEFADLSETDAAKIITKLSNGKGRKS